MNPPLDQACSPQPVPVRDVRSPDTANFVRESRRNGIPVVLVGAHRFTEFARPWVKSSGKLNAKRFLGALGEEPVPCVNRSQLHKEVGQVTKQLIPLRQFVEQHWFKDPPPGAPAMYMQQWQFPLSSHARRVICSHRDDRLGGSGDGGHSILGEDFLRFWVDACEGESPLQYLFMGRAKTATNLHSDLGGLGVIIAPILGEKEVTMVHRDDCSIIYDCRLDPLR